MPAITLTEEHRTYLANLLELIKWYDYNVDVVEIKNGRYTWNADDLERVITTALRSNSYLSTEIWWYNTLIKELYKKLNAAWYEWEAERISLGMGTTHLYEERNYLNP